MEWNVIAIIISIFGIITGVLMAISENKRKIGIEIIFVCVVTAIGLIYFYILLPIPKDTETILGDIVTESPPLAESRNSNESENFTNNDGNTQPPSFKSSLYPLQPLSDLPANNSINIELSQWVVHMTVIEILVILLALGYIRNHDMSVEMKHFLIPMSY